MYRQFLKRVITKKTGMDLMFEKNIGSKILLLFLYTDLEVKKRSLMQRKGISSRRKSCRRQKIGNRIRWKVKEFTFVLRRKNNASEFMSLVMRRQISVLLIASIFSMT